MSGRYVETRFYCETCKQWVYNNKISRDNHMNGEKHKALMLQRIRDSEKKQKDKEVQDRDLQHTIIMMEQAAAAQMLQDKRPARSAESMEQKVLIQQFQREERAREAERIRQVVMEHAGRVGPSTVGQQPSVSVSEMVKEAMLDPRAIQYRAHMEKQQKVQREAEEERIRLLCESKAAQYDQYQRTEEATTAQRLPNRERKQRYEKGQSGSSSSSGPSKRPVLVRVDGSAGGGEVGDAVFKSKRERRETEEDESSEEEAPRKKKQPPKVVLEAPVIGAWVTVKKDSKEEEWRRARIIDDLPDQKHPAEKDESEKLEELAMDPKEFSFEEKQIQAGSLAGGATSSSSKKKAKTVIEFKKRKACPSNIRQRDTQNT